MSSSRTIRKMFFQQVMNHSSIDVFLCIISTERIKLMNALHGGYVCPSICTPAHSVGCFITKMSEWILMQFGSGVLPYNMLGEFNFGLCQPSMKPTWCYAWIKLSILWKKAVIQKICIWQNVDLISGLQFLLHFYILHWIYLIKKFVPTISFKICDFCR